jgi:hypothetical protein
MLQQWGSLTNQWLKYLVNLGQLITGGMSRAQSGPGLYALFETSGG